MKECEFLRVLSGEGLVCYKGDIYELGRAINSKLYFADINTGEDRLVTTYTLLRNLDDFEYVSRNDGYTDWEYIYDIVYDYDEEGYTFEELHEEFIGDNNDIKNFIRSLELLGCYNISVTCLGKNW